MIKIGIFGILRMLLILPVDYTVVGYLLLAISLVSGLFGVMQAIVQHNLKNCWLIILWRTSASSDWGWESDVSVWVWTTR